MCRCVGHRITIWHLFCMLTLGINLSCQEGPLHPELSCQPGNSYFKFSIWGNPNAFQFLPELMFKNQFSSLCSNCIFYFTCKMAKHLQTGSHGQLQTSFIHISAISYQELHEWLPKGHFHVVSKRNAFFVCFPPCCGSSPQILYVADIFSRFLRKKAGRRGELLLSWCDDGPLEFWLCVGSQQSSQEEIHKVDLVLQMLAESPSTIRFFSPFL